jgi:hypothetical protein
MPQFAGPHRGAFRGGAVLMIVLMMLTLFAVVGLTFVFYANDAATSSRIFREANAPGRSQVEPELLFGFFMNQFIYDAKDDAVGAQSSLRGHSLARTMFGYNPAGANDVPYNGQGRLRFASPFPGIDDARLINYRYFKADGFLRDPERLGARTGLQMPPQRYIGGFNPPYTYPDLNHVYLGVLRPGSIGVLPLSEGAVVLQSYHRPWLFGPMTDIPDPRTGKPGNPNWTNQVGKYLLLRPRPIDNGPGFPYPEDEGGDVRSVLGGPGYFDSLFTKRMQNNDSVWLDLGAPIVVGPDGRKFKPLFAPFIIDLDGRLNLNVAGNLRGILPAGTQIVHASNMGWGGWEMNPAKVMNASPTEWQNLLKGRQHPKLGNVASGRLGFANEPAGTVAVNHQPRFFAPVDYDGVDNATRAPTPPLRLATAGLTAPFDCFPAATPGYANLSLAERATHPKLYNPLNPRAQRIGLANLEPLLRHGDTGSAAMASDLQRLCPLNFLDSSDPAATRRRRQVTLASFDLNRPGLSPYLWDPQRNQPLINTGTTGFAAYQEVPFPANLFSTNPVVPGSEFGSDWRTAPLVTSLRRLNLNRRLPDYPALDPFSGRITDMSGFAVAQMARHNMASEIFGLLCTVTGAGDPLSVWPPAAIRVGLLPDSDRWNNFRWLAQLSVNIVDFIDADDYVTQFSWFPVAPYRTTPAQPSGEWVFGTELPRVLINEAYVEYDNHPKDPSLPGEASILKGNIWVELVNTFRDDGFTLQAPWRTGNAPLQAPVSAGGYPIYRLLVTELITDLRQPENVRGEIRQTGDWQISEVKDFGPGAMILPADAKLWGGYAGPPGGNLGFAVLGPQLLPGEEDPFKGAVPPTMRSPQLSYTVPALGRRLKPSLILQRLACPFLSPNPNPWTGVLDLTSPYNPYLTVDLLRGVEPNLVAGVGAPGMPPPVPLSMRGSVGRRQPYAAHPTQLVRQQPTPRIADTPQHTFFRHNAAVDTPGPNHPAPPVDYRPFDWLVHLDRPLVSPVELFHVSAWKPHELTQEFINPTGKLADEFIDISNRPKGFNHRVPWMDRDLFRTQPNTSHRLYRAFEFLTTGPNHVQPFRGSTSSASVIAAGLGVKVYPQPNSLSLTGVEGTWSIRAGDTLRVRGTRQVAGSPVVSTEDVLVRAVGADAPGTRWYFYADFANVYESSITITPLLERIPGKVNVNTLWDLEVFDAVCDRSAPPGYVDGNVQDIFNELLAVRSPRTVDPKDPFAAPGPNDRPFLGLATGQRLAGDPQFPNSGLPDTLFRKRRPLPKQRPEDALPLFAVANVSHPYQRYEIFNKIFNHLTTRSNVFAAWVTVGFFEVTDGPVTQTTSAVSGTGNQPVSVSALAGSIQGVPWDIHVGSSVVVGSGTNEETVYVNAVDLVGRTFTANFTKAHPSGTVISHKNCLGAEMGKSLNRHVRHRMFAIVDRSVLTFNPGPQDRFDPRATSPGSANGSVVRYFSIID